MFVHVARRAQIGEILSGRRRAARLPMPIDHPGDLPRLDPQSVAAIWSSDPAEQVELPEFLLTADGQERDWLAWLVTFAPGLRPFTAFCRVMSASSFVHFADAFQSPNLGRLQNACIGAVLGEVLSSEEMLSRTREPLTASACASSLSFALVRELAIHKRSALDADDLPRRWSRVRELTRQRERGLNVREVVTVIEVLGALVREGGSHNLASPILRACRELLDRGEVVSEAFAFGPAFERAAREMSGTREERVDVFERMLTDSMRSSGTPEGAFAIGYVASRVSPGTLTHAALVAPVLKRYPAAMLWYGVCAGLVDGSNVLGELGGVGRRVLREVSVAEELLGRPRADIAASELEILLSGERSDDFTVYSPSQLAVELVPGVSTVVNWSSRARTRRTREASERPEERAWVEYELRAVISRLVDVHRRIRSGDTSDREPLDRGPDQPELFDRPPERRGTKKR